MYIHTYALPLFEQFFFQVPVDPMNCVVCFTSTHLTDGHPRCFFHHFPMARCVLPSREHEALLSGLDSSFNGGMMGPSSVVLVCSLRCFFSCIVWTIDLIIFTDDGFWIKHALKFTDCIVDGRFTIRTWCRILSIKSTVSSQRHRPWSWATMSKGESRNPKLKLRDILWTFYGFGDDTYHDSRNLARKLSTLYSSST